MRLEYDPRGDIAYIYTGLPTDTPVARTEWVGRTDEYDRGIDYDSEGRIVGYELMNASRGLNLTILPDSEQIAAFIASVAGLRVVARAS